MSEDVLISKAIQEGRDGLSRIIANPHFRKLINDYTLDDEAKKRIGNFHHYSGSDLFFSKMSSSYTLNPAGALCGHVLKSDEDFIKWFLLMYCISAADYLFEDKILKYFDNSFNINYHMHYHGQLRIDYVEDLRSNLVGDIIDVEAIMANCFPEITKTDDNEWTDQDFFDDEYRGLCISISLLTLSAGWHFVHDIEVIPDELMARGVGLPFVLSDALYISIITGEDYYDVLGNILYAKGLKGQFDDVIAMCRKNKALEELASERRKLENLLSENEEKRRVQITAGEIISEYYGKGVSKEDIEARVKKCNSPEYRKLLYELESINKDRLSFLSPIHMTGLANIDEEEIANHFGVIFSQKEFSRISTIEDLIDTIVLHRHFKDHFDSSVIRKVPLDFEVDESFDLETMTREVEKMYGITVERDSITNAEDLRKYVSENNRIYNTIVSKLVEKLGLSQEEITLHSNIRIDLGADSLDEVELIMDCDKAFGITIPEEEALKISTVEDIYKVVMTQKCNSTQ